MQEECGVKRHRYDTDEWMEAVIERYYRRRNLPVRRLEAAWNELLDQAVGPVVRWLNRRLNW